MPFTSNVYPLFMSDVYTSVCVVVHRGTRVGSMEPTGLLWFVLSGHRDGFAGYLNFIHVWNRMETELLCVHAFEE